jgi:hypothetical protein
MRGGKNTWKRKSKRKELGNYFFGNEGKGKANKIKKKNEGNGSPRRWKMYTVRKNKRAKQEDDDGDDDALRRKGGEKATQNPVSISL